MFGTNTATPDVDVRVVAEAVTVAEVFGVEGLAF
jgi:hypothetical protein